MRPRLEFCQRLAGCSPCSSWGLGQPASGVCMAFKQWMRGLSELRGVRQSSG